MEVYRGVGFALKKKKKKENLALFTAQYHIIIFIFRALFKIRLNWYISYIYRWVASLMKYRAYALIASYVTAIYTALWALNW